MHIGLFELFLSRRTRVGIRSCLCALLATVLLAMVNSCTSMSAAECQYQDWKAKGLVDGTMGKTMEQYLRYVRACDRHGFVPNRQDYVEGRDQGLQYFCTRENGFEYGEGGREYQGVCPPAIEHQFLSAYNVGREMFVAWDEVRYIESIIASNESRIRRLDAENREIEKELVDGDGDSEYRQKKLDEVKRNTATIGALTQEIYEQQSKRAGAVNRCVEVRRKLIEQGFSTSKRCHF